MRWRSDVGVVPNRILRGALTGSDERDCRRGSSPHNKHPALNGELFAHNSYKNRYVAKMATVEYEKCASIHTSWFDRFEYTIRVL